MDNSIDGAGRWALPRGYHRIVCVVALPFILSMDRTRGVAPRLPSLRFRSLPPLHRLHQHRSLLRLDRAVVALGPDLGELRAEQEDHGGVVDPDENDGERAGRAEDRADLPA